MKRFKKYSSAVAVNFAMLMILVGVTYFTRLIGLLVIGLVYSWVIYVFVLYLQLRRDELLHVLTTSVEAKLPLTVGLAAYLQDRPRSAYKRFCERIMLMAIFPFSSWTTFRHARYDVKLYHVLENLEEGMTLDAALAAVPGTANPDTSLAATVGQSTGRLGECLRGCQRWQKRSHLFEALSKFAYLAVLALTITTILSFVVIFIMPKFAKIFKDFGVELPESTRILIEASHAIAGFWFVAPIALLLFFGLLARLQSDSTLAWNLPLVSYYYRAHVRGRLLAMLGILLEAGQTIPDALMELETSGYLNGTTLRRVRSARRLVIQGDTLTASLQKQDLIAPSMGPLLQTAERALSLPWALGQLGELLTKRAARTAQNLLTMLFPISVFCAGSLVGFFAYAMFVPLTEMIGQVARW